MTKRIHNFGEKNIKKPKLDNDIDSLWGDDDIDESALDDCIKLATQVLEEEKLTCDSQIARNKIPSYSFFKEPEVKIFSSTQLDNFHISQPGTSNDFPSSNKEYSKDIEKEFENLQQRYQEKEGEVSILRTHIKETKNNFNHEQNKVQNEWKKKLIIAEKQVHSVKSELEFKNLEIGNLKQKLLDVTKRTMVNKDLNGTNNKTYEPCTSTTLMGMNDAPLKLHAVIDTKYPLHNFNTELILKFPKKEKNVINSGGFQNRNVIAYLQDQKDANRMCLNQCEISINIRPVLQKLISSTETELNSVEFLSYINKVIITADKLLDDLLKVLKKIKSNLKTENILQADTTYLKNQISNNFQSQDENVVGFNAGTILDFLAEVFPYNDYLRNFFSTNEKVNLKNGVYEDIYLNCGENTTGFNILNKVVDVLKLAGEIRESNMLLFLNSSIKLFLNICKSGYYNSISEIFCVFTKELIFLRPHYSIVYKITELFREASLYSSFVKFILNKSKSCSTSKKGIIYFNSDACRFYIFALMFEKCGNIENIPVDVCLNMLCFIYNTFKSSNWIHHQDTKECECLPYLYKLVLEILYRSIVIYEESRRTNKGHLSEWKYLIENRIILKIISLMTFHSYDLTEKYITLLSKYKEIERYFEEDQNITDLEKLSILEELPEVRVQNFAKVSF